MAGRSQWDVPYARSHRLMALLITLSVFLVVSCHGFAATTEEMDPWIVRTLHAVKEGTSLPSGVKFKQDVTLHALLFRWKFYSQLEHLDDGTLIARTFNAPSFMPDTLPNDLVSLGRSFSLFDVEVVSYDPKTKVLHVAGPRPDYAGYGAKEGSFWIDVDRGVVQKAEVTYNWGTLNVEQEYTNFNGYVVLSRQSARMRLYGATLDVRYSEYTIP